MVARQQVSGHDGAYPWWPYGLRPPRPGDWRATDAHRSPLRIHRQSSASVARRHERGLRADGIRPGGSVRRVDGWWRAETDRRLEQRVHRRSVVDPGRSGNTLRTIRDERPATSSRGGRRRRACGRHPGHSTGFRCAVGIESARPTGLPAGVRQRSAGHGAPNDRLARHTSGQHDHVRRAVLRRNPLRYGGTLLARRHPGRVYVGPKR